MIRIVSSLTLLVLIAGSATAGPLPWSYYVHFGAPDNAQNILLGTDVRTTFDPMTRTETSTPVFLIYRTFGFGPTRLGFETPPGTTDLHSFSYGDWAIVETIPENTVSNRFTLNYGYGNSAGASGIVEGSIFADGAFSSGTGNFTLGLSADRDLVVGDQRAHLHFGTRSSESQSVITMTITPEPLSTPEPATLALAKIGFAGLVITRLRRRIIG